jgi:hypothetical protein
VDYRVAFFMVGEAARLTTAVIFALAAYHALLVAQEMGVASLQDYRAKKAQYPAAAAID